MVFHGDRLDAGLSRAELAVLIGTGPSTIWLWEHGRVTPSTTIYRRAVHILLDAEEQSPPDWIWRKRLNPAVAYDRL